MKIYLVFNLLIRYGSKEGRVRTEGEFVAGGNTA